MENPGACLEHHMYRKQFNDNKCPRGRAMASNAKERLIRGRHLYRREGS